MAEYDRWIEENVPELTGRLAVVTGANSGLGFETAKVLASRGAHVILGVRNLAKGRASAAAIQAAAPRARTEVQPLDLADLASVRRFAAAFATSHLRLDMLINNAGVMAIPRRVSADGFEMQFGTNHLGHFALTGLLLPRLLVAPQARIVTVSSGIHIAGRINFEDLNGERRYVDWLAYAQSKLANLLFAFELGHRFAEAGSTAISLAAHPGYAATNLQSIGPQMTGSRFGAGIMKLGNRVMAQSAAMGALPVIYAATSPMARGNEYYGPGGLFGQRGFPRKVKASPRAYDRDVAQRLWRVSEELTGVRYEFRPSSS